MDTQKYTADSLARVIFNYSHKNRDYLIVNYIDFVACSAFYRMLDKAYSNLDLFGYDSMGAEMIITYASSFDVNFPKDPAKRERILQMVRAMLDEFQTRDVSLDEVNFARDKLREFALNAHLKGKMGKVNSIVNNDSMDYDKKVLEVEKITLKAAEHVNRQTTSQFGKGMKEMISRFSSEKADANNVSNILQSSFVRINNAITGYRKKYYYVIAGRPSNGKTTFLTQEAIHLAKNGYRGIFFTMEMSSEDVYRSVIQYETGYSSNDYMAYNEPRCGWDAINQVAETLSHTDLEIVDATNMTTQDIEAHINRYEKLRGKLDFVAIDYIQYIAHEDKSISLVERISEVSGNIRRIMREKNIVGLVAAQFNRNGGKGEKPMMADIKGSGAIEQDAAAVLGIHRESLYDRDDVSLKGLAEILILKSRFGHNGGDVQLGWNTSRGCFEQQQNGCYYEGAKRIVVEHAEREKEENTFPF